MCFVLFYFFENVFYSLLCLQHNTLRNKRLLRDFPGGPVVKNLLSNVRDLGSIPAEGT